MKRLVNKILNYYRISSDKKHDFAGHIHGGYEMNIVLKGELSVTCGTAVFKLKAGDMAIFDAGQFHRNYGNDDCVFISIEFYTDKSIFPEKFLQFYSLSQDNITLVNLIDNELRFGMGRKSEAAKSLLWALVLRAENDVRRKSAISDSLAIVYHNAVDIINDNLNISYSINQIAQQCGVSDSTLKNAFFKYTGKGVSEYCFELKMEKARELLSMGKSAKEIAAALGFSSLSYFSQCFRRKNGCSVREYIKGEIKND